MASTLIKRLEMSFQSSHDVLCDFEFEGHTFDLFAEYHERGEKYVLTKKAQLWAVEADEYVFVKKVSHLTEANLKDYFQLQINSLFNIVKPRPDHMSSAVALILLCESLDCEVEKIVKNCKFRKNYKLSFWGWADALLVVADIKNSHVYTNRTAKHMADVIKKNLALSK